jgi:hypothetical protein
MKRTLTLLSILIFCLTAKAQQTVWSENFENICCTYIFSWDHDYNTGAIPWQADYANVIGGICFFPPNNNNVSKVACVRDRHSAQAGTGCVYGNNEYNVFISSHLINMSAVSGAWLSYDAYFLGVTVNNKTESATVEISTDSGATWNVLQHVPPYAGGFQKHFVDLAAYNNTPNIKLGLRFNDQGEIMTGCMIDNIKIFVPVHKDLALTKTIPAPYDSLSNYGVIGAPFSLGGTVLNNGLDTVTSFVVKYQSAGGPVYADTFSNLSIPAFGTYDFTHDIPYNIAVAGANHIKMWVEMAGDTLHGNDSMNTKVNGAYFEPYKMLVIEEGTGTWNPYSPRGDVYLHQLLNDFPVTLISVHDENDPMRVQAYQEYLFYLDYNYVPYFLFDRRENVPPDSFFNSFMRQKDYFGFADITAQAQVSGNSLTVNTSVRPAIDLHGDYRLALAITEDNVTGTTTDYDQKNYWAGGNHGNMGGYENKPNPVPAADMRYDFVARNIYPAPDGAPGSLPANMQHNNDYPATFTTTLNGTWDKLKLKAAVLLIRMADSTILNSTQIYLPLAVTTPASPLAGIDLYPNPAADMAHLRFDLKQTEEATISVTDLAGKTLYQQSLGITAAGKHEQGLPVSSLSNGIYFVTIKTTSGKETVKLQVMH